MPLEVDHIARSKTAEPDRLWAACLSRARIQGAGTCGLKTVPAAEHFGQNASEVRCGSQDGRSILGCVNTSVAVRRVCLQLRHAFDPLNSFPQSLIQLVWVKPGPGTV